jgi:hypothetical protein
VSPAPPLATSRRAALASAASGLAVLTGCDLTGSGRPASPTSASAAADPDQQLADRAAAEVAETLALVTAAAGRGRQLARLLDGLVTVHEEHLQVLEPPAETPAAPALAGSADEALAEVLRRERLTQRRLTDWSVAAASGQLARLLASMSAAIAQQLVVTEQRTGPPA